MEEKTRKPDRRVVKTKKAIRNAFAKLLYEKPIDKITIKDIADTADINRKTFYNYYSGVYQLIDEIENEVIDSLENATKDMSIEDYLNNPYILFDKITEIINSDQDFYGYLLRMNTNVSLVSKIVDLLKAKVKEGIMSKFDVDEAQLDVLIEYTISGMIAVYRNWFNSNKSMSLEEVSKIMGQLWYSGIGSFVESKRIPVSA